MTPLRRWTAVMLLGLLVGLPVGVFTGTASAAERTVHLTGAGPSPRAATAVAGDRLVFVNDDVVPHRVTAIRGFSFDRLVLPGSRVTTAAFAAGSYTYRDSRVLTFAATDVTGTVTVSPAPAAPAAGTPAATAPPVTTPAGATAAPPAGGAGRSGTGSGGIAGGAGPAGGIAGGAGPAGGSTGGSGTATRPPLPGFVGGSQLAPDPGTAPAPAIAPSTEGTPPASSGAVSSSAGTSRRGSFAQSSTARPYGLPVTVAVLLIAGVLSLLLRLLLAEPVARRWRAKVAPSIDG